MKLKSGMKRGKGGMDNKELYHRARGTEEKSLKKLSIKNGEFNEKQLNLLSALQAQGDPPSTFPEITHTHKNR